MPSVSTVSTRTVICSPGVFAVPRVHPAAGKDFPSAQMVRSAASLLEHDSALDWAMSVSRSPDRARGLREGVQWRVGVSPGVVEVRSSNLARIERTTAADRTFNPVVARAFGPYHLVGSCLHESCRSIELQLGNALYDLNDDAPELPKRKQITSWSAKSRANMTLKLGQLDWEPMFQQGLKAAMITLTYPGDWLGVAPSAKAAFAQLTKFTKRFERQWGTRLVAAWKREFQRRGAPHWHLHCVPPTATAVRWVSLKGEPGGVEGYWADEDFSTWLARVWAEVVGADSCGEDDPTWAAVCTVGLDPVPEFDSGRNRIVCCEFHRHVQAGTDVSWDEGARASDPRRLAVYFSKHGSFAAKDYQNDAPAEWIEEGGSIGRFWGYWGLKPCTAEVFVTAVEADAARRTLSRYAAANAYMVTVTVWRKRQTVDRETGEIGWKWKKRRTRKWVRRLTGRAGYLSVNDGPAMVARLSGYLDQVAGREVLERHPSGRPWLVRGVLP